MRPLETYPLSVNQVNVIRLHQQTQAPFKNSRGRRQKQALWENDPRHTEPFHTFTSVSPLSREVTISLIPRARITASCPRSSSETEPMAPTIFGSITMALFLMFSLNATHGLWPCFGDELSCACRRVHARVIDLFRAPRPVSTLLSPFRVHSFDPHVRLHRG